MAQPHREPPGDLPADWPRGAPGALYLDRRAQVDRYLKIMDALSAEALAPRDTIRFLDEIGRKVTW